jgi:hypothetical protein
MMAALDKLSFFMTDRATNENKLNRQLTEWVNDELKKAELPPNQCFQFIVWHTSSWPSINMGQTL